MPCRRRVDPTWINAIFGRGKDRVTDTMNGTGWVLWAATIGMESPIPARVEAARAAGFTRLTMSPADVARSTDTGMTTKELGRSIRDAGLEIVLDPVMNWYGGTPPAGAMGNFSLDDVLRMSEALAAVSITVLGPFRQDECSLEELSNRFGMVCDRMNDLGAQVQIEFMPISAITDLATAWEIVERADRSNGGLLFDTWHFFRGNPDFSLLERVPGARIFGVQVSDAAAELRGSLAEDTFHRLMPGDGCFDLLRLLEVLDRIGGLGWIGPEVLSPVTQAMPPVEAARVAGDRVRALIDRIRSHQ